MFGFSGVLKDYHFSHAQFTSVVYNGYKCVHAMTNSSKQKSFFLKNQVIKAVEHQEKIQITIV